MSDIKYFEYDNLFQLESGKTLPGFKLAYQTFGELNEDKSNVVWVIHALTANSDPTDWWPGVVGANKAIDPRKHFIVCANSLGSHYGSTNPLDIDERTGDKYYHNFPLITNRDIIKSFIELRKHLNLDSLHAVIGASLGGQQALEWSIIEPNRVKNLILLATNAKHSPYGIAFNESQRLAIQADQTWEEKRDDAGLDGLKAARSIALLSYRTSLGYNSTQNDDEIKLDDYRASSYQRYQGDKLVRRFNAFSYWVLSKAMDSHNVGRARGGLKSTLSTIKARTTLLGIDSDFLFPTAEQKFIAEHIPKAQYFEISSELGHDGFLTEAESVSKIISRAIDYDARTSYLKVG